ncbi:MAG: rifamycin-inactivating phosphotransferase [Verrucomicrobiota bacterium]
MSIYVLGFQEIDRTKRMLVGGKGANLGELVGMSGIRVPEGFCVTTEVYRRITENNFELTGLLDAFARLKPGERSTIEAICGKIRAIIENVPVPEEITTEIDAFLNRFGGESAYAVRSSATTEDMPGASAAGQCESYLNVIGTAAILKQIRRCWMSLFNERAVAYRFQQGLDQRPARLAVVVQKMVFPEVSGVLFTADPVTGHRKISSVEATFGLGDALVSGEMDADHYRLQDSNVVEAKIAVKRQTSMPVKEGGTTAQEIEPERQNRQALAAEQLIELESIGRKIEAHFGCPQDIEWCWVDRAFYIVQSRPITTLFPIPVVMDNEKHVYLSVGHQQMMTDAMKPLGWSFFQLTAARAMYPAGGRLFVDVAGLLASPTARASFIDVLGKSDPLIKDALLTLVDRGFIKTSPADAKTPAPGKGSAVISPTGFRTQIENDPAIVADLIQRSERSVAALSQAIGTKSGLELFDFILEDVGQMRATLADPQNLAAILAAMDAASWLNEKMEEWLGEKCAADVLCRSVPHNITSEMGLALLQVADAIRPDRDVIDFLEHAKSDQFLEDLETFAGGREARKAIESYLAKYGMRCVGEIDITNPRWSEKPSTLVPLILGNLKNFEAGAGRRKFEQGREEALKKEEDLDKRLKLLPDGEEKAAETKRMISLLRNLSGYREYPKYGIVSRYFICKQALLKEADCLVRAGLIPQREDIYYLTFDELREAVRTHQVDISVIAKRREEFQCFRKLTPPRVMTSDGEIITGRNQPENLRPGVIQGLPVSAGVTEGRARVILQLESADLSKGDILVTKFTDPSWTPLFVAVKGIVTEVGGRLTHGAVIAREYGLPAVAGVADATRRIQDGQPIRVNGTEGYVEFL